MEWLYLVLFFVGSGGVVSLLYAEHGDQSPRALVRLVALGLGFFITMTYSSLYGTPVFDIWIHVLMIVISMFCGFIVLSWERPTTSTMVLALWMARIAAVLLILGTALKAVPHLLESF